jgi:hypothetical protein
MPNPHPGGPGLCIYIPPEAGWLPILVASYDTHGLRWDYSYSPVTTRGVRKYYWCKLLTEKDHQDLQMLCPNSHNNMFRKGTLHVREAALKIISKHQRVSS